MKKKGKKDGAGLGREASALHRALAAAQPPLVSVMRVLMQARVVFDGIGKTALSAEDVNGACDLAAAVMECSLKLGKDPGPIRRISISLLRELLPIISKDSLNHMMDVVQSLLVRKEDEPDGVPPTAAAIVVAMMISTGLFNNGTVTKTLNNMLFKSKKKIRNDFFLAVVDVFTLLDSVDSKTLDKVVDVLTYNKDVAGEGVPLLCLLCASVNSSKATVTALGKLSVRGTFAPSRNEQKIWAITTAVCCGNIAGWKVMVQDEKDESDNANSETETEALSLALRHVLAMETGDLKTVIGALLQYATVQSGARIETALQVTLQVLDEKNFDGPQVTEGLIQGFVTDRPHTENQTLLSIILTILDEDGESLVIEGKGRGFAARIVQEIIRVVGTALKLTGRRLQGVLDLAESIRCSYDDYARISAAELCCTVAKAVPQSLENLLTQSLEGLRVADLTLSTAPPTTAVDELPADFIDLLGFGATLSELSMQCKESTGVPRALLDRCCDDALALLRVHPSATKGALNKSIAFARRRVGWALVASFARSKLLEQRHLKSFFVLLKHELVNELPPANSKNYYQLLLQGASRAAALTAVAECLVAGLSITSVETIIGAAARRLAFHADARYLSASEQQRLLSNKIYRTEAPSFFRCVHLCTPTGAFGDICYYLAIMQLSCSQRRSLVETAIPTSLHSLFSLEGTSNCPDSVLLGCATIVLPALVAKDPVRRESLFGALVDLNDVAPAICAAIALHATRYKVLQSASMLARLQSLVMRVMKMGAQGQVFNVFELPSEVTLAAEAYFELAKYGGLSLYKGLVSTIASSLSTGMNSELNSSIASIVVLARLEDLSSFLGDNGNLETVVALLPILEHADPAIRLLGISLIKEESIFVAKESEKIMSALLLSFVQQQAIDSSVYIPRNNMTNAEALLEVCGAVERYGDAAAAVLGASRRFPQFPLAKTAFESAREITCELLGWSLIKRPLIRATALKALESVWTLLLDRRGFDPDRTFRFFCFGDITPEKLRLIMMESLTYKRGVESRKVQEQALNCLNQLRRGMAESRLLVAMPELPEALFLCFGTSEGDFQGPDYKALIQLAALCQSDATRRCAYWLRLSRDVIISDSHKMPSSIVKITGDRDQWDTNALSRGAAVIVARVALESIHKYNQEEDREPSTQWIEMVVSIVQRISITPENNLVGSFQAMHLIYRLFDIYSVPQLVGHSSQIQTSINNFFSQTQHPAVTSAAARVASSIAVKTSGTKLFSPRLLARFADVSQYRFIFQYDRYREIEGARATINLVLGSARLVCDAISGELTDVLTVLKDVLPQLASIFLAATGDAACALARNAMKLRSNPFEAGTSLTVAEARGIGGYLLANCGDIVAAATYLRFLKQSESNQINVEWSNKGAPGVKLQAQEDLQPQLLLSMLVALLFQQKQIPNNGIPKSNRYLASLRFLLGRADGVIDEEQVQDAVSVVMSQQDNAAKTEFLESLVIEGGLSSKFGLEPMDVHRRLMGGRSNDVVSERTLLALSTVAKDISEPEERRSSVLAANCHLLFSLVSPSTDVVVAIARNLCTNANAEELKTIISRGLTKDGFGMVVASTVAEACSVVECKLLVLRHLFDRLGEEDPSVFMFHEKSVQQFILSCFDSVEISGEDRAEFLTRLSSLALKDSDLGKAALKLLIMIHSSTSDENARRASESALLVVLVRQIWKGNKASAALASELVIRIASRDVEIFQDFMGGIEATKKATLESALRSAAQNRKI